MPSHGHKGTGLGTPTAAAHDKCMTDGTRAMTPDDAEVDAGRCMRSDGDDDDADDDAEYDNSSTMTTHER